MRLAWTKRDAAAMFQQMVESRYIEMGRIVARLRLAKGWTQFDLANAAGVSTGTVSRMENGKHEGRSATTKAIAAALGVKVQDILPAADADGGELSQLDRIERDTGKILSLLEALDLEAWELDRRIGGAERGKARAIRGTTPAQDGRAGQTKRTRKAS